MPVLDGVGVTDEICQRDSAARFVVLTTYEADNEKSDSFGRFSFSPKQLDLLCHVPILAKWLRRPVQSESFFYASLLF